MKRQQVQELTCIFETTSSAIEELLCVHQPSFDHEMASFIKSYLKSLYLDFELAMTRGEAQQLQFILEDVEDLRQSTEGKTAQVPF